MPQLRVRRPGRRGSRGQSLAEFALVLPIFMLILLIAVDFGRLFSAWVTVTNATRIAANYAGAAPTASFGPGSTYETTVRNESNNSQCAFASVPGPVFSPNTDVGSTATVSITCNFKLLTPFVGAILGDPIPISVMSIFTVRSGTVAGIPVQPPASCTLPNLVVPPLVGLTVAQARADWAASLFTGSFTPSSGHNGQTVTGQVPPNGACRPPAQAMVVEY
jgi:hypothetical protein